MSLKPVPGGELVFVTWPSGNDSALKYSRPFRVLRDVSIPLLLRMLETRRDMLKQYMAQGEEQTRADKTSSTARRTRKVYKGQIEACRDPRLLARKQRLRRSARCDCC